MKLLSKFFRVAVAGDTIDGRTIDADQIKTMAADYSQDKYGARVWTEHFRGFIPGGPFDALGDIVAAKAEEVKEGEHKGKMALYAQLAPLPALVDMNKAGQKMYTSIEMMTNFAKSGKPYLVGLAVTDTPASQGTEMLAFNSHGGDVIAGADHEVTIEMEDEQQEENKPTLFSRVKDMFPKKDKTDQEQFADVERSILAIAESQQQNLDEFSGLKSTIDTVDQNYGDLSKSHDELKAAHEGLLEEFNALADQVSKATGGNYSRRPPADGGDGRIATDC